MPFKSKRPPVGYHFPMAKSPGFAATKYGSTYLEALLRQALGDGFLEFHTFAEKYGSNSDLYQNVVYTDGPGAEELANGDFTGGDSGDWSKSGASTHVFDSDTVYIDADGSFCAISQTGLIVGATYQCVIDVAGVVDLSGEGLRVQNPSSTTIYKKLHSAGESTFTFIPDNTTLSLVVVVNDEATVNSISITQISQHDILVAGTVTPVAGLQGQRAGALGADVIEDSDMDDTGWWTESFTGPDDISWGASNATLTRSSGVASLLGSGACTVGKSYQVTMNISAYTGSGILGIGPSIDLGNVYYADPGTGDTGEITFNFTARTTGNIYLYTASAAMAVTIESFSVKEYTTIGGAYLNGSDSDLHSQGTALDGLTNKTIVMQFNASQLTSKTLLEKSGEFSITFDASNIMTVTRNRATTDATATMVQAVTENTWHELIVSIDEDGYIDVWLDGNLEPTTGTVGAGDFVSNTNPVYRGMDAAVSAGIVGVLGQSGIVGSVLPDTARRNWFTALDGGSYSEIDVDAFLAYMDSISGIDVRAWDFTYDSDDVGANTIETVNGIYTPDSPSEDQVVDGGIENWSTSTNATDWNETAAGTSTVNQETTEVHGGSNAVRLEISGANDAAGLSQNLTNVLAGDLCEITWWAKADIACSMRADLVSAAGEAKILTTAWQRFTQRTVATADNPTLGIYRNSAANATIYFDDVSVVVIGQSAGVISGTTTQGQAGVNNTPSAILSGGATSRIEVPSGALTDFAAATKYGYFGVAVAFSDGKLDAGRLLSWAGNHYLRFNGSGDPRLQSQIDYDSTDGVIAMGEDLRLAEPFSLALLHDGSGANQQELRIGYADTPITEPTMASPTAPVGSLVAPTGNLTMFNLPSSTAVTWDGWLDLFVYMIGFKPSDHIIRWLHNRIFTYGD